jgi:hypothetical protein
MKKVSYALYRKMRQEWLLEDLILVLHRTREEPGLSLEEIAIIINEVFGEDALALAEQTIKTY